MVIRIWQDSPLWIRADLIRPRSRENLYSRSIHPTLDLEDQYNDAEDYVRFNYPQYVSIPIERRVLGQVGPETI